MVFDIIKTIKQVKNYNEKKMKRKNDTIHRAQDKMKLFSVKLLVYSRTKRINETKSKKIENQRIVWFRICWFLIHNYILLYTVPISNKSYRIIIFLGIYRGYIF